MVDYRLKYLKYKMKYLTLLGGSNFISNSNTFETLKNDGTNKNGRFSNQCLWLSILSYLNIVLENNLTLEQLREIASSNDSIVNGINEEYDFHVNERALNNVVETYDLQIHFYQAQIRNSNYLIGNEPLIYGNIESNNVVAIVSYGYHFELIIQIGKRKLYRGKFDKNKKAGKFVPDRQLILGKKSSKIDKLDQTQQKKLDELFETLNNLLKISHDIEQHINLTKDQLIDLDERIIFDEKSNSNQLKNLSEEEQIVIIVSYQEYKKTLEKTKGEFELILGEINEDLKRVRNEINRMV